MRVMTVLNVLHCKNVCSKLPGEDKIYVNDSTRVLYQICTYGGFELRTLLSGYRYDINGQYPIQ